MGFLIFLLLAGVFFYFFYVGSNTTGAVVYKCSDTDGGVNIYSKGEASSIGDSNIRIVDRCTGLTSLDEAYCTSESGVATLVKEICPVGYHCNDASCIETVECNDLVDNDKDGAKDYPNDSGCSSLSDEKEN